MEIYLGLDICRKNIQMSYYREESGEPESVYQPNHSETYQLPNVMFYAEDEKKWYVANEVSEVRFRKQGQIVEDVLGSLASDRHVVVEGAVYTYDRLLLILLRTHIEELLARFEDDHLQAITVTWEEYRADVYAVLMKLRDALGLSEDTFHVIGHESAFFQYVMHQDEQLRTNSVAMFEYGTDGMLYDRIDRRQQGSTKIFYLRKEDFREKISYAMLLEDVEELDRTFAALAKEKLRETYISSVYLTGAGFTEQWMDAATKVLCDGRRVFMGQNLYTKGACYHARFGAYETERDCVLCTQGSIPFDIGVCVGETEGRNYFYPIAIGGREWYNMKGKATLFLDDTNRIEMLYRDKVTKEMQREIIEIHGLPKRPPKTTKLSLEVELNDEQTGAIVIRDVGFGRIYPTTNKIYRRDFTIGRSE